MAEEPVMESATDSPAKETVVPTPKPSYKNEREAVSDLKNLLNLDASKNQEAKSEPSTDVKSDSETNNEDPFEDAELIDQVEDENTLDSNQELYKIKVGDQDLEVSLDELKDGYYRQQDYTRKTKDLADNRKAVDELKNSLTRQNEEAKIKRDQYEKQLQVLEEQLKASESKVDLDKLYEEDPAQYVRAKAEIDRRKEILEATKLEQEKIHSEKQKEHERNYNAYLERERKLLAEKLPIYADSKKGPEFVKNITNYAREIGYTEQEISMLVDHKAVIMLANAYRYDKLKKANLNKKKVTTTPKVVSSSSPKSSDNSEVAERMKSKKAVLRKSGKMQDAVSIFKEMYS
tara:strand:- start:158 stop:1198 length:1041 start_codon:yes stop_codon:yes gene_type:complete